MSISTQMVERPWGMSVYGAASVKAKPDLARIRFKVVRLAQTPEAVFSTVSEAVHAVRQCLRDHSVVDSSVESSRLNLKTVWDYGKSRKFAGYECHASFSVESGDLDDVQALLVDLVAAGANEIDEVTFDVKAKRELRAQARQKAVAAAREKAELYAAAAGVRMGTVQHIEDVDPERMGAVPYRGSHSSGQEASGEDFAPGHVVVSAAVVLGFSIG
ncbi:MAG TPA: SIMPL domain-containing protein [Candidatus Limnocylindrales bacterium]